MIKLLLSVLTIATVSFAGLVTTTNTYNFTPTPNDLGDLQHDKASSWGINFNLSEGEVIKSAVLSINNLYNWRNNEWNALFINLIDNSPAGVTFYNDLNMGSERNDPHYDDNYFAGVPGLSLDRLNYNTDTSPNDFNNIHLHSQRTGLAEKNYDKVVYNDDGRAKAFDVSITLNSAEIDSLTKYINNNGNFGFGVDADCHFKNSGFKFTMTTETTNDVPEPATLSLLGFSLIGLLFFRRKRN